MVVFFLSLLIFQLAGPHFIFNIQVYQLRKEIKKQIKSGIPLEKLHKLSFSDSEKIDWVREGIEFRVNDQMFDIVLITCEEGVTHYFCVNDTEEALLFSTLDDIISQQFEKDSGVNKKNAKKIIKQMFSTLYLLIKKFEFLLHTSSTKLISCYSVFYSTDYFYKIIKPPEFFI